MSMFNRIRHKRTWLFTSCIRNGPDTVLGMNLSHGGHLTHGAPVNFSGKFYNFVEYGVDKDTELRIDCTM